MNRTMKQPVIRILGERPNRTPSGNHIPADALIYNAPRPLYGSAAELGDSIERLCWEGDFISGIFYAAILPDDPDRAIWIRRNWELGADRLQWVTMEQIRAALIECYQRYYDMTAEQAAAEIDAQEEKYILLAYRAQGLNNGLESINA